MTLRPSTRRREIDELTFDNLSSSPPPARRLAHRSLGRRVASARAVAPPAARPASSRPPAVSAPSSIPTAPVSVQLSGAPGQTDISIPVEVVLNNGTAQVQIHLRLTLNLKLDR